MGKTYIDRPIVSSQLHFPSSRFRFPVAYWKWPHGNTGILQPPQNRQIPNLHSPHPAPTYLVYPSIFLTSARLIIVQTSVFMTLLLTPCTPNPAECTFHPLTGFLLPLSSCRHCLIKAAIRPPYLNLPFMPESVTLQQTHLISSLFWTKMPCWCHQAFRRN